MENQIIFQLHREKKVSHFVTSCSNIRRSNGPSEREDRREHGPDAKWRKEAGMCHEARGAEQSDGQTTIEQRFTKGHE